MKLKNKKRLLKQELKEELDQIQKLEVLKRRVLIDIGNAKIRISLIEDDLKKLEQEEVNE